MTTPSRPEQPYQPPRSTSGTADGRSPATADATRSPEQSSSPTTPGHTGERAAAASPAGFDDRGKVKRGRISAAWVGLIAAALVLILLIIFIAQNLNNATVHFLGLSGRAPLGLLLLIAAVAGVLLVALPGSIRILQLRRALKRNTPKDQRLRDGQR